jgi:hypothetical protein
MLIQDEAVWVVDGTYRFSVLMHGTVLRVSHHNERFSDKKRPSPWVSFVVKLDTTGQELLVSRPAALAVGYATPGAKVTLRLSPQGWARTSDAGIWAGHTDLNPKDEY